MFKEFTIEQVFTVKKVYGRPQKTYEIGDTAYVTGAKNNNGVVGFVKADDKSISKGNCISVDPITGMSCYQPVDFVGRGFSGASINLLYNDNLNEKTALFVCSVIEKVASSVAAYTNLFNSTRLATAKISLPVIESSDPDHEYTVDDIDWQYMQDRIAELEQDRIAELEAYLAATGLDDYELTAEDERVLCDEKKMAEFKVRDVFGAAKLGKYHNPKDLRLDANGYEYICASNTNNGVNANMSLVNGDDLSLTESNIIAWGKQCPMFTYHPNECVTSQGMYYLELGEHTKSEALYVIGVLSGACKGYCYTNCLIGSKMDETFISLPVITSSDPNHNYTVDDIDWQYMERYIRAMEKVAIADVVKYKDKIIETTKQVVVGQEEEKEE